MAGTLHFLLMRVICAPDSFKESISAIEAAAAMAEGVRAADAAIELDSCPIADGGEGTVDALVAATGGTMRRTRVTGPTGRRVEAAWGVLGDETTAVIEMAEAAGLAMTPKHERDPTQTTTFGVGELIAAAMDEGVTRIVLGIGGSATTDGGCATAQALGATCVDANGHVIERPITGGDLAGIAEIDLSGLDPRLGATRIVVACDVTNPLCGPSGAAAVYGPQKGATAEQVESLDAGLAHLARLVGEDHAETSGAGAAGGLGFGLIAMLGARLRPGVEMVLEAVGFAERAAKADWCLTGEGRLDGTSLSGKACVGVMRAAKQVGTPTIALAGTLGESAERLREAGFAKCVAIGEGLDAAESIRRGPELLRAASERVVRQIRR